MHKQSQLSTEPVVTLCMQVCQLLSTRGRQQDSPWVRVAEAAGLVLPENSTDRNLVLDKLRGKFNKYMEPIFGWIPRATTQVYRGAHESRPGRPATVTSMRQNLRPGGVRVHMHARITGL